VLDGGPTAAPGVGRDLYQRCAGAYKLVHA